MTHRGFSLFAMLSLPLHQHTNPKSIKIRHIGLGNILQTETEHGAHIPYDSA